MNLDDEKKPGGARWLWFLASVLVGLPLLALCGVALVGPPSPEAAAFTVGVVSFVVGGLISPWRKNATWAARAGFLLLLSVVGYRFLEAGSSATITTSTGEPVRMESAPRPSLASSSGGTTISARK